MARAPFGFAPWPMIPAAPDDEATPVGLAPGQMPVDPRRDGSAQPTASGKKLSGAIGGIAGGMAQGLLDAAKLPGDVYAGRVDPMSDEGIQRANDLAGFAMTGGIAAPAKAAGEAALGSGPIRAYHGSPHSFDRFDVSKLGSGEGAQAYGHGLYFADNEAVARSYRDTLAPTSFLADGAPISDDVGRNIARSVILHDTPIDEIIKNQTRGLQELQASGLYQDHIPELTRKIERAKELRGSKLDSVSQGHMYEVAIDADPKSFLNWDTPLSAQNLPNLREVVRPNAQGVAASGPEAEVIRRLQTDPRWGGGWDEDRAWRHMRDAYPQMDDASLQRIADGVEGMVRGTRAPPPVDMSLTGGALMRVMDRQHGPVGTAQMLQQAGIPGVRYLDGASRGAGGGTRNTVTFGDDIVSIVRKYGLPGAIGAGGAAAALAPDDAQAAPSSSGASPMAAGARAFSFMPDFDAAFGRPRGEDAGSMSLVDQLSLARGMQSLASRTPAQAAPAPAEPPQSEPAPVAPFSFAGLAPRASAPTIAQSGFGPGSTGAGLPLPPQEPASTASVPRPVAPARAAPTPAPSRTMTNAPLPPPRPPEFGSSADPGQPLDIRPPAQAAAPSAAEPSTWDKVSGWIGNNSDMLIGIGTGLMSTPGITRGFATGVQNGVAMQNASAAQGLARAKQAVEMQKLQQGQRSLTANAQFAKNHFAKLGTPISDDFAMSVGSTPEVFNKILTGQFVAPEGYNRGPDGALVPVQGGDKDPATIQARAQAQAAGTAAGKPDETYTLLPEERRVAMGLPAGSYQVDSKNKISPVNPTGTTINMGAEKAQDAKVGGGYGDYQLDIASKGRNAASTLNTLALMEQAMRTPGFYSGVGGDGVKRANQFLAALGVKDAKAASGAEVFDALSNKVVLDGLGGSLGPGISNTDRDYISRTAPTLQQSEEGNRNLIGIARSLAQRQQAVAKLARDYATKNGGRIDGGFDQALEEFAASNPLFPQASAGVAASPPQEAPQGAPRGTRRGADGSWYAPDPARPGKYLRVEQ